MEETPKALTGARLQLGVSMFGHVRRADTFDPEPGTLAPGGQLGLVWRVEGWELGPIVRGAYFKEPYFLSSRRTIMMAAGRRARWFAFSSSSVTPFIDVGPDLMLFGADDAVNIGPALHAGAGLEVWHNDAHHRLRFDFGVDLPTFALNYPEVAMASASRSGQRQSWPAEQMTTKRRALLSLHHLREIERVAHVIFGQTRAFRDLGDRRFAA